MAAVTPRSVRLQSDTGGAGNASEESGDHT